MAVPPRRRSERYQPQPTMRLPGRPPRRNPSVPRQYYHPRRRNRGCGIVAITIITLLVLAVMSTGLYAYNRIRIALEGVQAPKIEPTTVGNTEQVDIVKQPFNMLLIGVDLRSKNPDGARSDTLILVRVDPQNQWASMLSIPRDSYAYIPYKETREKINAAYSYGYSHPNAVSPGSKPELAGAYVAKEAVESFLDLESHGTEIHHWAQVNFEGFRSIIDTIGGITVDVAHPILDPEYPSDDGDNGYIRLFIPAGLQYMDGTTALRYARSRHTAGDIDRAKRQQQVLQAVLHTIRNKGLIDQLKDGDKILNQLGGIVKTTLPLELTSLRALGSLAKTLADNEDRLQRYVVSSSEVRVDYEDPATYEIHWNKEDLSRLVDTWLQGPPIKAADQDQTTTPQPSGPRVQVYNGARVNGLAGEVSHYLESQGFQMLTAADAPQLYDHTTLIDYTGREEVREQLAQILGIKEKYILIQPENAPYNPSGADIMLILGRDYREDWRGVGAN